MEVSGVEENVNSRFIDYTKATPWEHLIADIEKNIRLWIKPLEETNIFKSIEIEYLGKKFLLSFELHSITSKSSYLNNKGISLWFDTTKFIVFNKLNETLSDVSERRVLFSALIAALDSSRAQIPIFISSEPIETIIYSKEVLGYEIISPRITEHNAGDYHGVEPAIYHYESVTLDNINRKHSFYYLDGLGKLFGAKLWKFSSGTISVSEETIIISVWEHYDYQPPHDLLVRDRGDLWGISTPTSPGFQTLQTNDSYLQNKSKNYNEFHAQSNSQHSFTSAMYESFQLPPVVQSTMEDLLAPFPDGSTTFVAGDIPLSRITVQIHYDKLKQSAIVDNDYYTTLLPSKLPYSSWSAEVEFSSNNLLLSSSLPSSSSSSNKSNLDNDFTISPSISPTYSSSLRKLLALYICGKSCRPGHTYRSVSGKDGPITVLNIEKAMNISSILSIDTRRAVFQLCKSINTPNTDSTNHSTGILSQDLLMRVFSRSLWIDISDDHNNTLLYNDNDDDDNNNNDRDENNIIQESEGLNKNINNNINNSSQLKGDDTDTDSDFQDCNSGNGGNGGGRYGRSPMGLNTKKSTGSTVSTSSSRIQTHIGKFPMPWKWLSNSGIVASPVGSWLSLVAVYTSSLNDIKSMASLWVECMEEVRIHWENRVPIPRLYPPIPISTGKHSRQQSYQNKKSHDLSIWENPLWNDIVEKKSTTATPFMLPDTSQCLPFQKLQMINMCIICIDEVNTIDSSIVKDAVEVSRLVGKNRLSQVPKLEIKRDQSILSDSSESQQDVNDKNSKSDTPSDIIFVPVKVDYNRDISHLVTPKLQRRLPATTDTSAQYKKLAKRMDNGLSRTINDKPTVRWQVSNPEILSDIRSFKAVNPDASLDDFLVWYGGMDEQVDAISMVEIWESCQALEAEKQKSLFKAEQEAEKALGYLEGLSLTQLAATLLSSAMTSFYLMITCDIKLKSFRSMTMSDDYDESVDFQHDLDKLESQIHEAIELIEMDTSMFGTTNHAEISISQKTLQAIDIVCCTLYDIEVLQMKMMSCRELLDPQRRLITQLSRHGTVNAENYEEAKVLFNLAKTASFGGDSHTWHSVDGRELGPPTRKIFDLRCGAECNLINIPKTQRQEVSSTTTTSTTNDNSTPPLEHCMRAILQNDQLRVAFRFFEVDNVT